MEWAFYSAEMFGLAYVNIPNTYFLFCLHTGNVPEQPCCKQLKYTYAYYKQSEEQQPFLVAYSSQFIPFSRLFSGLHFYLLFLYAYFSSDYII
jgi:hypothetical protein